ncbi:unnamed protein product [Orchesella dallaii]|uniref:Histone-lysine N-methyltransferase eggless n=1 Tax=Orchesella dallaii TaxID=48710 RepID=A0ABP1RB50_9HEXA
MDQCNDISSTSDPSVDRNVGDVGVGTSSAGVHEGVTVKTEVVLLEKIQTPLQVEQAKVVPKSKACQRLPGGSKKVLICGIPNCGKKTDQLKFAPTHALVYYGFRDRFKIVKACLSCLAKADEFQKKSMHAIRSKKCMFTITKHEPQFDPDTVDIADEDDEDTSKQAIASKEEEEVEVDFERGDVETLVKKISLEFGLETQVQLCVGEITKDVTGLEYGMDKLYNEFNEAGDVIYNAAMRLKKCFENKPEPLVVQEVDISADGTTRRRNRDNDFEKFVNSETLRRFNNRKLIKTGAVPTQVEDGQNEQQGQSEAAVEFDVLNNSITSTADLRKPGPASKTGYYDALDAMRQNPFQPKVKRPAGLEPAKRFVLLPTPSIIPRVKPKKGDYVYAMNRSLLNYWLLGEVEEIVDNEATKKHEYVVHYEPTKKGKLVQPRGVLVEGSVRMMRQLTLLEMAYNIPCPFVLPVGTRIIAKFKDELNNDPETDGQYYAGIVAEPPKPTTINRYLIFFDDGYAQYVSIDEVLLVCESSREVWKDIHPDSYDFMKEYITRYPDWPMVRLPEKCLVSTEWNGKWLIARVIKIDCSLARVKFENDGREEWIYRGSPRFQPIFNHKKKVHSGSSIPRHDPGQYQNLNAPTIVYNNNVIPERKTARKSTGRYQFNDHSVFSGLTHDHINMEDPDICIEFQGTVTKLKLPKDAPQPADFVPHTCNPTCVIDYTQSMEFNKLSPLAIPLHLGWSREATLTPRHEIYYRAPCGRRIKNYDELNAYLEKTDSNIPVDFFTFEYALDCLQQFEPARTFITLKDISYGKEARPIQCVNSVDYEHLAYVEYIPNRIPGPGVNINLNDEFLACCDCTDNCQDKSKCACWKLTESGICFTNENLNYTDGDSIQGYRNRRLGDHIVTGIYECNSKCRCKSTCTNRVVQNGLTWPLQIFKTAKKGWGIRAIHDMPPGTFICIYSGQIFPDVYANDHGMELGDEYFAELDYIECCERTKGGYESDVSDIEANESDNDEERGGKKSKLDDGADSEPEMDSHAADSSFVSNVKLPQQKRVVAARRTNGQKRALDILNQGDELITARTASHFTPQISLKRKKKHRSLRKLFGPKELIYVMDAKTKGNVGRYLNHSCAPNVFVQNVFVDTHDARFPLVAFFTNKFVRAGTELTWDYHYEIGSVAGKTLHCFCDSPFCKGRLL